MTQFSQAYFASDMARKRVYVKKSLITMPSASDVRRAGGVDSPKVKVGVRHRNVRAHFKPQPTPIKDYINFKEMSGNEILLNLDNNENLANTELVSGLLELGK